MEIDIAQQQDLQNDRLDPQVIKVAIHKALACY